MTDDDILLRKFFDDNKQAIPDNGFSEKVIKQIPLRNTRLVSLWQCICAISAIALFIIFKGWYIFVDIFYGLLHSLTSGSVTHVSWISWAIGLVVCMILMIREAFSVE
jgi:hypothetical protein